LCFYSTKENKKNYNKGEIKNEILFRNITRKKVKFKDELSHYCVWTKSMIDFFWKVQTSSLIVEQFYPIEYWYDLVEWARPKINKQIEKICDIGCGNGNMIKVLSENFPEAEIVGVDLTEDSLKFAKDRFKSTYKITFKVGNITTLPFPDDSIDLITVTEVLEHLFLEDFFKGFNEMSKKLRKGAYLLATIPFNEKLRFVSCPECGCIFHPYQHMIF
jgi:2-polyprenyl-3-methyl-5-hydroxy-6-metoxy-1,4-benzoquinol methylase